LGVSTRDFAASGAEAGVDAEIVVAAGNVAETVVITEAGPDYGDIRIAEIGAGALAKIDCWVHPGSAFVSRSVA